MALLSYIISTSDVKSGKPRRTVRIIRKLFKGEDMGKAEEELRDLISNARLKGEIRILPDDNEPIHETVQKLSSDASLILMGMQGERAGGLLRLFSLDKHFFSREFQKYDDMPPLLFVKASSLMRLF